MTHRAAAVASRAIALALRGESFTAEDVRRGVDDPPSRATVYRVLRQLEADEWIEQRGNGWHPDVKARLLGDAVDGERAGSGFGIDVVEIL